MIIILFIIFLIIISLLLFINYLFKEKNKNKKIYIESFSSENKIKQLNNNIIVNGSFENGKDSPNHINQNGYNKIIMKKNPGLSSYVLEQKKSSELTYYEFSCKNNKNSKYNLYFWLSIENQPNIESIDFEKLIKIKIQNQDYSNYIPRLNYNIIQKIILSNNTDNTWYLLKYDFISDNNTSDKMQIYLNYSEDLQYDIYYFTNIALYRVLIDAENFIYNDDLICYADGYSYESNNTTWRDLSGNGNDLFWSNIPITDYNKGSINTENMKLKGFVSDKLSNNKFTILFCLNKNIVKADEINTGIDDVYLISVPGNDRYSFEIQLIDNYLYLICGKDKYKSKNEVILYNKSLLSIQYDNGNIYINYDGVNILTENIRKIYFGNDNIIINRNKNLNYNFYSILFYNRLIDNKELDDIREYFITNKNKDFNTPDLNVYQMNSNAEYTVNNNDNNLIKPFNSKLNTNSSVKTNLFTEVFDNKYKLGNDDCLNNCLSTSSDTFDNFKTCITNCGNDDKIKCPKVYKKDGKYIIYVAPNSYYSEKINYSGEKSYGTDIKKAAYTYHINFPRCPIPDELIIGNENKYLDTCPYVINELNPCYTSACGNVNWNVKNYNDLNLNKNCKKAVSNYCQINYNLDEKCICWDPKYKDDPRCSEFKRYFEDPNDYCSPGQFKIEDHPDFDKYIKKDNIPCWGCNLNM